MGNDRHIKDVGLVRDTISYRFRHNLLLGEDKSIEIQGERHIHLLHHHHRIRPNNKCVNCNIKHTYIYTHRAKPSAAVLARSRLPSEPALGHLCATQVLGVSAGKSSLGRTSNLQEAHR